MIPLLDEEKEKEAGEESGDTDCFLFLSYKTNEAPSGDSETCVVKYNKEYR